MNSVEKRLRDCDWVKRNIIEARLQILEITKGMDVLRDISAMEYSDMPTAKGVSSIVEAKFERLQMEIINLQSWNDRLEKYYKQECWINSTLDKLPDNQRQVVEARAIKGLKWYLVSRATGYSVSQAKRLYYQALSGLSKESRS